MSCARLAVSAIAALAVIAAIAAPAPPARAAPTQLTRKTLPVNGGTIELSVEQVSGAPSSPADIERWVRRAAVAVAALYGGFPMRRVRVMVWRTPGRGIHGTAFGSGLVRVRLGVETPPGRLDSDWVMTHELIHLGFPDLDERHIWMEEGLSTYFEPIARARVGQVPVEQVWREMFRDLPQGLQRAGDAGLDRTPTWGATYWGGALFWLLADVQIRERTGNRRSADDALRAILAAGGDQSRHWPIEQVLAVGDRATGTDVLAGLYRRLALRRFEVDLRGLAARLGVTAARLDDRAPLAAIRRSITAPEPGRAR
ncbi:MAG TPA: hypothetical protein VKB80_12745 [Kofleriaceae bacterium]|nr:hypothetical protein [Kofleriaceae bacterium]